MLPTGVTFPLGLHVQADWLLVVTRREMMQLEGNEWHEEILQQLPTLIRYYLQWLITHKCLVPGWHQGYGALPSPPVTDIASDKWFGSPEFAQALKGELKDLAFLPSTKNGKIVFVAPSFARFLPTPLAKELESPEFRPDVLFGDRIISNRGLGGRAKQCLDSLQLIAELSPEELSLEWKDLVVKRWLALFPDDSKYRRLASLLEGLSALDEQNDWRAAALICLPTASGGWESRGAVSRYPADWNTLAQEDEIRRALEPVLGSPETMMMWDFDAVLQQMRSAALSYLNTLPRYTLEEVTNRWWEELPEKPSEQQIHIVIGFTAWVLRKQPQRKRLIQKVLCSTKRKGWLLLSNANAVLADPYAGSWRRVFFESTPTISAIYEEQISTISRSDWRAFFENLIPPPAGLFYLSLSGQQMSRSELSKFANEYTPHPRRSTWLRIEWRGLNVQSDSYTVVEASLPGPLATILEGSVTKEHSIAISQWLGESPSFLPGYRSTQVAYIPYMSSSVQTESLPKDAQWVDSLRTAAWIYSKTGDGPFTPSDVLPSEDIARPNAPVANLLPELVQTLQTCGIKFGIALPDAPSIDRLRIQGPTSSAEELSGLLQAAIDEASDDQNKKELLLKTLKERSLFVLPPGLSSIDGATRITLDRVVVSDRPRSLLGYWLVAIDSFAENTPERNVLELAASISHVPRSTTFAQVLKFLSWVWNTMPDADRVRRILPRAYSYVTEEINGDNSPLALWTEQVVLARVFVQRKRKWVLASEDDLFFDDLNNAALEGVLSSIDIATAGHLGDTPAAQVQVANLLGVKPLSSRFDVVVEAGEAQVLPGLWQSRFNAIQDWLRLQLKNDRESEFELDVNAVSQQDFRLSHWGVLRTVVSDSGTRIQENEVKAAVWRDGTIAVSGMPGDFAEELCKVLFNEWRLRLRRDLVELIPRVAIQLTRIGDSEFKLTLSPQQRAESMEEAPAEGSEQSQGENETATATNSSGGKTAARKIAPEQTTNEQPALDENAGQNNDVTFSGGSYTDEDREARLQAMIAKKKEIEGRIQNALTLEISPEIDPETEGTKAGEFRTDNPYRDAALNYERKHGRYPIAKGATQPGHDIDSYTHPILHAERKLVRRIEIKGRGVKWDSNETVEMSDTQFGHALSRAIEPGEPVDGDFDYWLYVVETDANGDLSVLPIRNVAKRAARFALKGGSWRHQVEE